MNPIWQQDIDEDIALKKKTQDAIAKAVAAERESCAKIAEDEDSTIYDVIGHPEEYPRYIGLAIRARGKE